jgi:hypothetical protein
MGHRLGSNWRISVKPVPEESAGSMAGKLKTYQTSLRFFDLAIAAPSMEGVPIPPTSPGGGGALILHSLQY